MKTGIGFLLVFGLLALVILYSGTGGLSFTEAKSRAETTEASLSAGQLEKLGRVRRRFTESAIPACVGTGGSMPANVSLVLEIRADGYVSRSWRRGDSRFAICMQTLTRDNFFMTP
jgi:pyrroline-5-carboxylate reductase